MAMPQGTSGATVGTGSCFTSHGSAGSRSSPEDRRRRPAPPWSRSAPSRRAAPGRPTGPRGRRRILAPPGLPLVDLGQLIVRGYRRRTRPDNRRRISSNPSGLIVRWSVVVSAPIAPGGSAQGLVSSPVVDAARVHPDAALQPATAVAHHAQAGLGPQVELDLLGQQQLVVEQVRGPVAGAGPRLDLEDQLGPPRTAPGTRSAPPPGARTASRTGRTSASGARPGPGRPRGRASARRTRRRPASRHRTCHRPPST